MNLKKVTQKNADGSSISYEFDVPKMQGVPDHPGEPKGPDTVPAWLTPGEFVMNAEATRMFEPQIEAMNDAGRAVQRQQGGTIPEYKADGGNVNSSTVSLRDDTSTNSIVDIPVESGGTITPYSIPADASGNINDLMYSAMSNPSEQSYTYKPGQTEDRNQNIYNLAYEGSIDLNTVPNATPFDKSIIMQAMKASEDALANSTRDVPLELSGVDPNILLAEQEAGNQEVPFWWKALQATAPDRATEEDKEALSRFMRTEADLNQRQRLSDLTGTGNVITQDLVTPQERMEIEADGGSTIKTKDVPTISTIPETSEDTETKDKGTEQANVVNNTINETEGESNPGTDGVSNSDLENAGDNLKNTDPDMWDKAKSFIGDAFDEILDTKSLTQAAMLYLGSRALGYSHAGSINFVGKNYAQQIGNKLKIADKASLSNKYTKDSVEKYRKSGNLKDLELAKNIQKLETVDMVDKSTGKTVTVTKLEDKVTGKTTFVDDNMKTVDMSRLRSLADSTAYNTKMQGRVSSNFKAEVKRASGGDDDVLNELSSRLPNDQAFGEALVRQANKMGLDSNTINNSAPSIVRDMIRDLGQDRNLVLNETAIMPYINKQLVSFSVKDNELKKQIDNASTEVIEKLNQSIASDPAELNSKWKQYSEEFSKLKKNNPEKYSSYVRRAGDGFTPIAVYITEKLAGN